jgi:hypothetical protein
MKFFSFCVCIGLCFSAYAGITLEEVASWRHDQIFGGRLFAAAVDKDGALIGQFQGEITFLADQNGISDFRPTGEGPGDLASCFGIDQTPEGLAVMDHTSRKIKIFTKKEDGYEWKRTVFRKVTGNHHFVNDLIYYDNKWFVAGYSAWPERNHFANYHLIVLGPDGDFLGKYVKTELKENFQSHLVVYFAREQDGVIYLMAENDPVVHVFSAKEMKDLGTHRIKPPSFYRPPSEETYTRIPPNRNFQNHITAWRTSYSSIANIAVTPEHFVVQYRTAIPDKKIFVLMFYARDDFTLVDQIETNHQLVANEDDLLYFIRNGMPGYDDEAGECHIDILKITTAPKP